MKIKAINAASLAYLALLVVSFRHQLPTIVVVVVFSHHSPTVARLTVVSFSVERDRFFFS